MLASYLLVAYPVRAFPDHPFSHQPSTSSPLAIHHPPVNLTALRENKQSLAWGLLFILALIWGSSFILIKRGVEVLMPSQVGSLRIFAAGVFLLPLALVHYKKVPRGKWGYLFLCGSLGNLIPSFLFSEAGAHLNSSVSGVLNALTPLFTLMVGMFLFHQRISTAKLLGLLLGFAGCTLLIFVNGSGKLDVGNWYAIYPVLATICYGINANLIKQHLSGIKPLHIAALSLCSVAPLAGVYFFSAPPGMSVFQTSAGITALSCVLVLGVLGTAIATVLFNQTIQLAGPLFTSSVTYLIPIIAVMWGVLDGERLFSWHYLSMVAIIAGVYLANRPK